MSTIYFTLPHRCTNPQCAYEWHRATYHKLDSGGFAVDLRSDGNFEDINESDLPEWEAATQAHVNYAFWVAHHGADPLDVFTTPRTIDVAERWEFRWTRSIAGPVCTAVRRYKQDAYKRTSEAPEYVREYLDLRDSRGRMGDRAADLIDLGYGPLRWNTIRIRRTRARSPLAVSRELRRFARKYLSIVQAS